MAHLRAWAKAEIEAMTPIQIKIVMGEMRDEYQAIDSIVGVANPTDTLYLEASNSMRTELRKKLKRERDEVDHPANSTPAQKPDAAVVQGEATEEISPAPPSPSSPKSFSMF